MSFEQVVKIPVERVGVVIGREGSTKKTLEEELGVHLDVDGRDGAVTVKSEGLGKSDPLTAVRVVEAIGRGFSPRRAARLLDEDSALELIDLRDYAGKSTNSMGRIRGRVIGVKGKSRRVIEELTDCYISVYGRSVAIIGSPMEVVLASEAVKMLASGSQHKTVYNTLQKARTKKKFERMFLWEGSSPDAVAARAQRTEGD